MHDRWDQIEEQIKSIAPGDDLEVVKARLCATVDAARAESLPRTDQLTGLPGRSHAEAELIRASGQPDDCYLALFVVKRLALINARFGYGRGDEVLQKVVLHLVQSLPNFESLFRWTPCAFITVAPPDTSYQELCSRIETIELARLTLTLEWEGRSDTVPVTMDCRVISLKDCPAPSELFLRLDTLAADT